MKVQIEHAYEVACRALGDSMVREILLEEFIEANIPKDVAESQAIFEGAADVQDNNQGGYKENGGIPQPTS